MLAEANKFIQTSENKYPLVKEPPAEVQEMQGREKMSYSQLIPLTTESATSLAASSYTCFVEQSPRNTLSVTQEIEERDVSIRV